jgi:hypothetical protein
MALCHLMGSQFMEWGILLHSQSEAMIIALLGTAALGHLNSTKHMEHLETSNLMVALWIPLGLTSS